MAVVRRLPIPVALVVILVILVPLFLAFAVLVVAVIDISVAGIVLLAALVPVVVWTVTLVPGWCRFPFPGIVASGVVHVASVSHTRVPARVRYKSRLRATVVSRRFTTPAAGRGLVAIPVAILLQPMIILNAPIVSRGTRW